MDAIQLIKGHHPPQEEKVPTLAEIERTYILQVLDGHNGHVRKAAKILGISKSTLYKRLAEWKKKGLA